MERKLRQISSKLPDVELAAQYKEFLCCCESRDDRVLVKRIEER